MKNRPRKLSYKELQDRLRQTEIERDRFMIAMNDVISEPPEASEIVDYQGDQYVLRLYRSASPAGGYILVTFRHPGQKNYTTLHDAEEFLRRPISFLTEATYKLSHEYHCRIANERRTDPTT